MKKLKTIALALIIFQSLVLNAQETFTYMQYNLLYYGSYTDWCTTANNNISDKAENLATIIAYAQPDIFCVNEMDDSQYAVNHLLGNALNVNGVSHYRSAAILNNDDGSLINMLYYNQNKFSLLGQESVTNGLRDINIYELSYKDSDPLLTFRVVVAHLKAGSYSDDMATRAVMTSNLMDYLMDMSSADKQNIIFSGDFNTQSSSEQSFQNLINPEQGNVIFLDPVNQLGEWNNQYSMRYYHTQSTHTSDDGCPSYGGMDDRYDFILVSEDVLSGDNGLEFVSGSYRTLGQDGNRYNQSLISPTNNSAPSDVIYAMYNFSDHLPVMSTFRVTNSDAIAEFDAESLFQIENLKSNASSVQFELICKENTNCDIRLYDMLGKEIARKQLRTSGNNKIILPCSETGMLILRVCSDKGNCEAVRLIK